MSKIGNNDYMEDISSSTKKSVIDVAIKEPVDVYGTVIYKNLSKVIKTIAYICAIANLLMGFGAAAFVFKLKFSYIALSFALVLIFAVLAAVLFFIIYGIGHSIEQNDEILKKLK